MTGAKTSVKGQEKRLKYNRDRGRQKGKRCENSLFPSCSTSVLHFLLRYFAPFCLTCCHAGLLPSSCPSTCKIFPRGLAFNLWMDAVGSSQMLVNLYRIHGIKPRMIIFLTEATYASTGKVMDRGELLLYLGMTQLTIASSNSLFLLPPGHHTFNWIYVLKLFLIIFWSQEFNFQFLSQIEGNLFSSVFHLCMCMHVYNSSLVL